MNPHFSVPFNFGGIPRELSSFSSSGIVILPVPYDSTTVYQPGARNGPLALIEASRHLEPYDEESGKDYMSGICTLDELDVVDNAEDMVKRVYESVSALLSEGKKVVVIGGEHSISSGSVRAHKEKFPGLSVIHIDAHGDMRDEFSGNKFSHACVARRISEICPIVQVGIRSISAEEVEFVKRSGHKMVYATEIASAKDDSWMDKVVNAASQDVYVTIDLDALDPGIMPSVGTPEPGGLGWYQLIGLMEKLAEKKNVRGFDVVELSPQPGNIGPDFTAAKLVYRLIGLFFKNGT